MGIDEKVQTHYGKLIITNTKTGEKEKYGEAVRDVKIEGGRVVIYRRDSNTTTILSPDENAQLS